MSGALIIVVLVAVVVGAAAALGAGPLVLVVVPLLVGAVAYAVVFALSRRSPGDVARDTNKPEFLGPGGPDDPDG